MIKVDTGTTSWRGHKIILTTELTALIHSLIEKEVFTSEEIDEIVATAKKTKEELDAEIEALKKEVTPEQVSFVNLMSEFLASVGDPDLSGLFS